MSKYTRFNLRDKFKGFVWGLSPATVDEHTTLKLVKFGLVMLLVMYLVVRLI